MSYSYFSPYLVISGTSEGEDYAYDFVIKLQLERMEKITQ